MDFVAWFIHEKFINSLDHLLINMIEQELKTDDHALVYRVDYCNSPATTRIIPGRLVLKNPSHLLGTRTKDSDAMAMRLVHSSKGVLLYAVIPDGRGGVLPIFQLLQWPIQSS